ncbi:MAG: DNA-binding response regulator, LuxR family, partial [uncultured Rubrobacteraceae bacterium]
GTHPRSRSRRSPPLPRRTSGAPRFGARPRGRGRGRRRRRSHLASSRAPAGRDPDGPQHAGGGRHRGDAPHLAHQPSHSHPRHQHVRGRRFGVRRFAGRRPRLSLEGRPQGRDTALDPRRLERRGDLRPFDRQAPHPVLRRPSPERPAGRLPRAHRARARDPRPDRPARDEPRDRQAPLPEPQDGAQPRLEHLHQAPGLGPRAGHHPRPRSGVRTGEYV